MRRKRGDGAETRDFDIFETDNPMAEGAGAGSDEDEVRTYDIPPSGSSCFLPVRIVERSPPPLLEMTHPRSVETQGCLR
eukprot:COSAG02_NODE_608_length_19607_cov_201.543059_2_plen_79_part_00